MDPEHAAHVESLCLEALSRDARERAAFLDEACGGDADLRREVESLLAGRDQGDGLLQPSSLASAPPLTPGTRLGPYEIQSFIGAGGMGQVYKAHDTRLGRTVAIKILPPDLAAHVERRRRFEQEARAASALNDPHICTLHDIGSDNGTDYLVMEYLDGETLAARLRKGRLPLQQALDYATQIADALSKAHRQGIVHRDLKPGNVMLTKSGAKLLDFGLAKLKPPAVVAAGAASAVPTLEPATTPGMLLGTIPYMAPEQLEGKEADARSDIFSFGAVLYEMLAGKRAFEGESHASVIAAILEHDPAPLSSLQPVTPPALDRLVRRCLAKTPDDRPDTAHDIAEDLRWLREASGIGAGTARHPVRHLRVRTTLVVGGLVFAAAIGAGLMWLLRPTTLLVTHPSLEVSPADEVNSGSALVGRPAPTPGGSRTAFTWTPDGEALVFVGRQAGVQRLYVRPLVGGTEARRIANTEDAQMPAVSPDGQWVAFWAHGKIRKVRLDGGPPTDVSPDARLEPPFGLAWADSGALFFGSIPGEVMQIPVEGQGAPRAVTKVLDGELRHMLSSVLPGGRAILYTVRKRLYSWGGEEVVAQMLATGTRKTLLQNAVDARYVASGHLVFLREGRLFAVPFDPDRLERTGNEVPVLQTVAQALTGSSGDVSGAGQYAVSSTGHLAWVPSAAVSYPLGSLVTVDRQGRVTRLPAEPRPYVAPVRLSPDGRQLAVTVSELYERGLWVYDLGRPNLAPRPVHRGDDAVWPAWSRDSRQMAFMQIKDGTCLLVTKPADSDASAPPSLWVRSDVLSPSSFTLDGHILAVRRYGGIMAVTPEGHVQPKIATPGNYERWPALSPNGRWLAYGSEATGRIEVYVTSYPDVRPADAQQVSIDGGESPAWRPNGRELFFVSLPNSAGKRWMMAAEFSPGPGPRIGSPHGLFEFNPEKLLFAAALLRAYEVSSDGRFYGVEAVTPQPAPIVTHINLIENWFEELKVKAPRK